MKLVLKIFLAIIIIAIVAFASLLLYLSVTKYKPSEQETLYISDGDTITVDSSRIFNVMIWNIGYAGLDQSMDFFYDGGKKVRPTKEQSELNFNNILQTVHELGNSADFILLQEVDEKSKRSYKTNQMNEFCVNFPDRCSSFALNYNVRFVPVPVKSPMGSVKSGLLTLSSITPTSSVRYSFPSSYGFPKNLAMLNRCFLVNRYDLSNGKQLLIINTHNSAYDDGSMRKQEMDYLKTFLTSEYQKGNYIVVGGDWNQCPPNFNYKYTDDVFDSINKLDIPSDYLPDWTWSYDPYTPTNRRVIIPYTKGETATTIIDYYLLSPNLKLLSVTGVNKEFASSDHNPVLLTFAFGDW
ncbi:MAG: hypothetical protein PHP31_01210 [Lentimicrobiaceae bacterium]|nr:hypothetical protein [Lentimicrobiaceae bacterium]